MTFKRGYIEVCLTTEDGIQHLRCHGWLKRQKILVKAEQVFGKGSNDFGMFIIVIPSEELYELMDLKDDMFSSFEVMNQEEERWNTYKKKKDKDFIQNISNFMFSLAPENKIDIDIKSNSAVITTSALEQVGGDIDSFIDFVLEKKPKRVINIEPILEFSHNNEFDNLMKLYCEKRNYLKYYYSKLLQLERENKIKILFKKRTRVGGLFIENSVIVWEVL